MMQLTKAERQQAKIKMALQGPSGSGKTYSSLLLAFGLSGTWSKIAVIDTENHSANLYAHLGEYNVVNIGAPYNPEKYVDAIRLCEESGMEVIIIDSISHEWDGSGGILDVHGNMAGNSFTNWSKLTPRHNNFVQAILQSHCHIIGTIRSKQDYVLQEKNGKMVPEKVGLKGITRDGMDYEFTVVLDIDIKHHATATKDRTGLFVNMPEFTISVEAGTTVAQWCKAAHVPVPEQDHPIPDVTTVEDRIMLCKSIIELIVLYNLLPPNLQKVHVEAFSVKRKLLSGAKNEPVKPITQQSKLSNNGSNNQPTTN